MGILLSPFRVLMFIGLSSILVSSKNPPLGNLLIGDAEKLFMYDTNGQLINQIADVGAHSIDYDCKNKEIVWTNWDAKAVYITGTKRNEQTMSTLPIPENLARENWFPKSVAVDSSSHKVYVANIADHSVFVYDKTKTNPKQIYKANNIENTQIWHLAIDAKKNLLFIQSDHEIIRIDLKKGTIKKIYSDILTISRITLDTTTRRIYWVNAEVGKIASVNYEGSDDRVHYDKASDAEEYSFFDSLTIIKGILYWADFDNDKLIKLDLSGRTPKIVYDFSAVQTHALKGINC